MFTLITIGYKIRNRTKLFDDTLLAAFIVDIFWIGIIWVSVGKGF